MTGNEDEVRVKENDVLMGKLKKKDALKHKKQGSQRGGTRSQKASKGKSMESSEGEKAVTLILAQ